MTTRLQLEADLLGELPLILDDQNWADDISRPTRQITAVLGRRDHHRFTP
ncbi:MAG: hypothetical protein WCF81_07370 [Roseiarcus sp.]